ncbi:hypothetical protein HOY82DRAFT_460289, partial [Tuber indicum]
RREGGKNETLTDPSRKNEVAITTFNLSEGSFGFRPISDIESFLSKVLELRGAIDNEAGVNSSL